ncbi:MAG: ATP-binding cassette domain-containing protein [Chlamydiae bacterium]|nr:ATP-binding cassette domain-containing protein [Chlamydiota bacterium]
MENGYLIQIEGLTKSFRDTPVLTGLNLDIHRGETLVIIGQSGEGKSVLLKHIIGLLKPDSGRILIDGRDIVPMSERDLNDVRKRFGFLFQGAALFDSLTVGENVSFGLTEHTRLLHSTSIAVTHDMASAFKIADRIAMLYDGKIIEVGTPENIRTSQNEFVQQFITGRAKGPITKN